MTFGKDNRFFKQENNDVNSYVYDSYSLIPGFFKVRWNENLNGCSWGYGPKGLLKMSKVTIGDNFWRRAVHCYLYKEFFFGFTCKTNIRLVVKQKMINYRTDVKLTFFSNYQLFNILKCTEHHHIYGWLRGAMVVAAGSPVFLFPALLDHMMSFFVVVRSYLILERFTRSNDVLTLDNEYISLVVRIGLFRPNKVLTPVYKWICTLQWWRVWLTLDKRPVVRRPIIRDSFSFV